MSAQQSSPYVQITESFLDIGYYLASVQDDPKLYETVLAADLLILPTDLSSEDAGFAYPAGTRSIFQHLQEQLAGNAVVEAPVRDEDYREFAYHSQEILLPILFVAKVTLFPIAVSIIASFIRDKLRGTSDGTVKSELHFNDAHGAQWMLKYDGPASTYERLVCDLLDHKDPPEQDGEKHK